MHIQFGSFIVIGGYSKKPVPAKTPAPAAAAAATIYKIFSFKFLCGSV